MRPTFFARFLLLLIATALALLFAFGQPVTQLPDQTIYRGNNYTLSIRLARPDSALLTTVLVSTAPSGRTLTAGLQPSVSRSGRDVNISYSQVQTRDLPEVAFLQIMAGGVTRFQANLYTNRTAANTTPPGQYTVVSPVSGAGGLLGLRKIYNLSNAPPQGYQITHGVGTSLVTGAVYRQDTGQIDPLWRIIIISDNVVEVRGVPGETMTGRVVLDPVPITSQ